MKSVLLLEDSKEFQLLVKKLLQNNYEVHVTEDPDDVLSILSGSKIDLILLDITLPKRDGYSVLSEVQASEHAHIPVICLTGKMNVTDKITAFSLGADDFIQKPFEPLEFKARVDARIKKSGLKREASQKIQVGDVKVDLNEQRIFAPGDREIDLTSTEFKIFTRLAKRPGNVFSREQLLNEVWGDEGAVFDRAVDVHICSLRKKFGKYGVQFKSVPGVGYKLILGEEKVKKVS